MRLALLPLLLVAGEALGAPESLVAKGRGGDGQPMVLRIFQTPCTDPKVAQHIKDEYLPRFFSARLTYGGKDLASCWTPEGGLVYSIDESGELLYPIPASDFKSDVI